MTDNIMNKENAGQERIGCEIATGGTAVSNDQETVSAGLLHRAEASGSPSAESTSAPNGCIDPAVNASSAQYARPSTAIGSKGPRESAYLGIDIGSISTKGVIIDGKRNIIARSYQWTEGNPTDAARRVIAELGTQIDHAKVAVRGIGTTGSARRLVGAMCGATVVKNEITAHAVGTTYLHPDVRTILEIGGQDSKIICVEGGIAIDYAMNTLCAAGTGAFLSSQAHRLGVEVEQFGEIALTSKKPANIAARCTVFAESDLVHKIQVGYAREDIIAGLCRSVAVNYLNNVGKGKNIVAPVVFQGGVSKNIGVVKSFEKELGMPVIVDPDGHLMGAFGVALLAAEEPSNGFNTRENANTGGAMSSGELDFNALADFEFVTREVECNRCANHCEIICVYQDGKLIDSWGNRCEKGEIKPKA